jgi:tyrosine-protein phosphatase SIW14
MKSLHRYVPVLALAMFAFPSWAAEITAPGVPNFHQVSDKIYRGGQPQEEGWQSLAKLGVKTVVDLRQQDEHDTSSEAQSVQAAGMHYVNVPMKGTVAPTDEQIRKVLGLLDAAPGSPVFVHCRRGADRTGTVIACYRMSHDRWQNEKALHEAKSHGMSWLEFGMKHYIQSFHPFADQAAPQVEAAAPAALPAAVVPAVTTP